jgi:hypothetical protein
MSQTTRAPRRRLIQPCAAALLLLPLLAALSAPSARAQGLTVAPQKNPAGAPADLKSLPAKQKRYALVVGVDKYTADTQITTLGGASNDARALAEALVRYAGFPADQVILLASDQPAERQPTRGQILRRLSNLASVVPKDGLLLFSFAGHGMERGGQAFLLPSDAQAGDDPVLLEQTAINVLNIRDWVKKSGVRQVLLILDACRNDPGGRAEADNPLTQTYTRGFNFDTRNREVEAFATLYATAIGYRAYEFREKRQGYFTWALVEGLKGSAANARGEVTLASLVNYLQERVPKQVSLDLGATKVQRPFAVVEGYKADELIISVAGERGLNMGKQLQFADEVAAPDRPEAGGRGDLYVNLEGTTWTANPVTGGTSVVTFQKDGKLLYTLIPEKGEPNPVIQGTWKQEGKSVVYTTYRAVVDCKFDEGVLRCNGENDEGEKFHMTYFQKRP